MNWYNKASNVQKERKPYKIFILSHGTEKYIDTIWAHSSEQARMLAIKNNSKLMDYLKMGYEILSRLDVDKGEEVQRYQKLKEDMKEEQIQNAWWQD